MAFMDWRAEFSVGVAIFDDEHRKLIALINQLHDAITTGASQNDLNAICDGLIEYTLMHFRHEEMYFDDWGYPDAAAHIANHAKLREEVFTYRQQIGEVDGANLADEMMEFLRQWLTIHIMVEDRAYGEFLYDKGVR